MPFFALGVNLAKQIGGQFSGLVDTKGEEMDAVVAGFSQTMKGELKEDAAAIMSQYGPKLNEVLKERAGNIIGVKKTEGADYINKFLADNKDATTHESGIVVKHTVEGTGAQPGINDTVEVHYHGMLIDGTVFDSSVQRGQTISFPLLNVIKGWQEGLQLMKEGGKATLVIPSDLAYGDAGSGETISPGATLVFEVELFKVEEKKE